LSVKGDDMELINFQHEIILSENRIRERILELGNRITLDYRDGELVVIGILKGSLLFFADLIRNIHLPVLTDFLTVSSYEGNMKSSGNVNIVNDITLPVKDRDVLIVEDIIDTGSTSKFLMNHLERKNPCSLKICTLLNKKCERISGYNIPPDYSGFVVPDKFLIGYGLDYKEKYRNLPYIAAIEKDIEGVESEGRQPRA
jgi:hypoxanthine phosphoribosyltransferase